MSDEQIIYISPEDDLTNIRERLEQVQSKRVTMVIPANTQLRSHVAWKLLYVRARELGKEVLIVSSDAQIRSVAHAVKFRVATSLEAARPAEPRPASRPGRTNAGPRSRTSTGTMRATPGRVDTRGGGGPASTRRSASLGYRDVNERQSGRAEQAIRGRDEEPLEYSPSSYDFRIDTAPPIHSLPPQQLEEEPDLLLEDFNISQDIRNAALGSQQAQAAPEHPEGFVAQPARRSQPLPPRMTPLPQPLDDPFASMEDDLPPALPGEQHGAVSLHGFATSEHEIQDVPDSPIDMAPEQIEDEAGAFMPAERDEHIPPYGWPDAVSSDEEEVAGPSGTSHVRPRSSRPRPSDRMAPLPSRQERDEEDELPAIEDQPTRVMPPEPIPMPPARPGQRPSASTRRSVPLQPAARDQSALESPPPAQQPASRQSSRRSVPLQPGTARSEQGTTPLTGTASRQSSRRSVPLQPDAARAGRGTAPLAGAAARPGQPAARAQQAPAQRTPLAAGRGRRTTFILVAALILLALLLGALAYAGPSAQVALTLRSRSYTHALSLTARQGAGQSADPGVVPAQMQTRMFSTTGTVTATGSKKVGTNPAVGNVTFTNTGQRPIIVPTGTIVSTPGGIQFITDAEISVNKPGQPGDVVPVPVHAAVAGDNSNLPAGTITVIPQDSLNAIAKNNNLAVSDVSLKITNNQPTAGGGLGNAPVMQQQDLDAARKSLGAQLQPSIDSWLNQWSTKGVISKPTRNDILVGAPQANQVVNNVNVAVTLQVTVSVLFVRSEDVLKAVAVQLNQFMKSDVQYHDYIVPADVSKAIKLDTPRVVSNDATAMALNYNATARVVPNISQDEIRREVTGMSVKSAQELLGQQPGVQQVTVKVAPDFWHWLPFLPGRIDVSLQS